MGRGRAGAGREAWGSGARVCRPARETGRFGQFFRLPSLGALEKEAVLAEIEAYSSWGENLGSIQGCIHCSGSSFSLFSCFCGVMHRRLLVSRRRIACDFCQKAQVPLLNRDCHRCCCRKKGRDFEVGDFWLGVLGPIRSSGMHRPDILHPLFRVR